MMREPGRPAPEVWRAFCGHFAGTDFRNREALLGRWQKWIGQQFVLSDKDRDRERERKDANARRYADHTPKYEKPTAGQTSKFQAELARRLAEEAKKGAA
jgi:hypothetical protein